MYDGDSIVIFVAQKPEFNQRKEKQENSHETLEEKKKEDRWKRKNKWEFDMAAKLEKAGNFLSTLTRSNFTTRLLNK